VFLNGDGDGDGDELRWPAALLRSEALALLAYRGSRRGDRVELLLSEAFADRTPRDEFRAVGLADSLAGATGRLSVAEKLSAEFAQINFLRRLSEYPAEEPVALQPYYAARRGRPLTGSPTAVERSEQLRREWARLVEDLRGRGYLQRAAPRPCLHDPAPPPPESKAIEAVIEQRLGVARLWPLEPHAWDEDTFCTLVEVVHDLVARPRMRWWDSGCDCDWHYSAFAVAPGRDLYRWRVNRLLDRFDAGLQLAANGHDAGRLVSLVDDGRALLVEQALASSTDTGDVAHAIALFRGRAASPKDKRSAIVTLIRILERNRALLKAQLFSKDEGALFQIANEFDLRHSTAMQKTEYDDAFLDWLFWWYLATIELTHRLSARQVSS